MSAPTLSPARQDAFIRLLDDTSPGVRKALLEEFRTLGLTGIQFLRGLQQDSNAVLSRSASWYIRELNISDPIHEFRSFIESLNYELETGLLLINRIARPELDFLSISRKIDVIAERCRELAVEPTSARELCLVINRVLFHEMGFRGDTETYADPRNSYLDEVLRRKKGLPLTLSCLYILVAERIGLHLDPVALPGHFIVGCFQDEKAFYIDPFDGGSFSEAKDLFERLQETIPSPAMADLAPLPVREVLCRCCRNLARHCLQYKDHQLAYFFQCFVDEFESIYQRHAQS